MVDIKILDPTPSGLYAATWPTPDLVEGQYALIQRLVKCLFTVPGDMEQDPGFGADLEGRLRDIPGQRPAAAATQVQIAAGLIAEQCRTPEYPRLVRVDVMEVSFDLSATTWVISLDIVTDAGTTRLPLSVRA